MQSLLRPMIHKDKLKGKYVSYLDRDGKQRTERVIRVNGFWITVQNCLGRKRRVHKKKVLGVMHPKRGLETIAWK